ETNSKYHWVRISVLSTPNIYFSGQETGNPTDAPVVAVELSSGVRLANLNPLRLGNLSCSFGLRV
ncbi:Hypothetical protein CINCED_3A019860, partial [Cinara cedri]